MGNANDALMLIEELASKNPGLVEAFQQLHGIVEQLGEGLSESLDVQEALLSENADLDGRLDHQSRFVAALVNGMMDWRNSEEPVIQHFVALVEESAELQQRVNDADFRGAWVQRAEEALGDRELAETLARLVFDDALYDEGVIQALMTALSVKA